MASKTEHEPQEAPEAQDAPEQHETDPEARTEAPGGQTWADFVNSYGARVAAQGE